MSGHLSRLLVKPQKEVSQFISQMEDKYCYPSHDVRLLDEVGVAVKRKITSLDLDPNDTTGQEFYYALLAKFDRDSSLIDRALGIKPDSDFDGRILRAIEIARNSIDQLEVWALKPSIAKRLLISQPPKRLAKLLHYRSVDSMLKREAIGKLYLLFPSVESSAWQKNFARAAAQLSSTDYSLQPLSFVVLPTDRTDDLAKPLGDGVSSKLTASVALWPSKRLYAAPVITLALVLIHEAQKLGASASLKSLLAIHPVLNWWNGAEHLLLSDKDTPVSMNIRDVAHNHHHQLSHEHGRMSHGAKALWRELEGRYQALGGEVEQAIQTEAENLIPAQLAAQYQEA